MDLLQRKRHARLEWLRTVGGGWNIERWFGLLMHTSFRALPPEDERNAQQNQWRHFQTGPAHRDTRVWPQ